MAHCTTPALVLSSRAYRDTDTLLRVLTPHEGVLSVLAKGSRTLKSRRKPFLEPGTLLQAQLHSGRSWWYLSEASPLRSSPWGVAENPADFSLVQYVFVLLEQVGASEDGALLVFARAEQYLSLLFSLPPEQWILAHVWICAQLLSPSGYIPELDACIVCGAEVCEGDRVALSAAHGGVVCVSCGEDDFLSDTAFRLFRFLLRSEYTHVSRLVLSDLSIAREVRDALLNWYAYHAMLAPLHMDKGQKIWNHVTAERLRSV